MSALTQYIDEITSGGIVPFSVSNLGTVPFEEVEPYVKNALAAGGNLDFANGVLSGLYASKNAFSTVAKTVSDTSKGLAGLGVTSGALFSSLSAVSTALATSAPYVTLALGAISLILDLSFDVREYHIAMSRFRRAKFIDEMVKANLTGAAFAYSVSTPSYTDCDKLLDIRRKTVVTVQRSRAPWRNPGSFRKPTGNCAGGFKVKYCESGEGNQAAIGAGGSRCYGDVDLSALLYPWWCGNGPPRPAPFIDWKGEVAGVKKSYKRDPNATLIAMQQQMLRDPVANSIVPISTVLSAKKNLQAFQKTKREIYNGASQRLTVTSPQVQYAIDLCDAFISARAGFLGNTKSREVIASYFGGPGKSDLGKLDKALQLAVFDPNAPSLGKTMTIQNGIILDTGHTGGSGAGIAVLGLAVAGGIYLATRK